MNSLLMYSAIFSSRTWQQSDHGCLTFCSKEKNLPRRHGEKKNLSSVTPWPKKEVVQRQLQQVSIKCGTYSGTIPQVEAVDHWLN